MHTTASGKEESGESAVRLGKDELRALLVRDRVECLVEDVLRVNAAAPGRKFFFADL